MTKTLREASRLFEKRQLIANQLRALDDRLETLRAQHAAEARTWGLTMTMFQHACAQEAPERKTA